MKIGVDVDGVIINSDEAIRVEAELYDLFNIRANGIQKKEGAMLAEEMYDWNQDEINEFVANRIYDVSHEAPFVPGAIRILKQLQKDGHELILITARGRIISESETEERLKEAKLEFSKKYYKEREKVGVAKKENIDIMIDDRGTICKAMSENKIHGLYLRDVNRPKFEENEYFHEVNNWGEIYRFIYCLDQKNRKENKDE